MVDLQFSDPELATLYDGFCAGRRDFGYYLPLVHSARSVLDVGCGTGDLLHRARAAGHTGRLVGLDPADGMLSVARTRTDVEWVLGDLGSVRWNAEFDLAVMTGNAFQVLITDDEVRTTLAGVRSALTDGGRFAFETRDPRARAWEGWVPEISVEVTDPSGARVREEHRVESVEGDLVRFSATYTSPDWDRPKVSRSTLRFLDADRLESFLTEAGLVVEEWYGNWDRSPVTDSSPAFFVIARRR